MSSDKQFSNLSRTVDTVASILGEVIKEQAGEKYFKLVEEVRKKTKLYRTTGNKIHLLDVHKRINKLTDRDVLILAKSFTVYFHLANISEQVFREPYVFSSEVAPQASENLYFSPFGPLPSFQSCHESNSPIVTYNNCLKSIFSDK